jgi:hypothetical protein
MWIFPHLVLPLAGALLWLIVWTIRQCAKSDEEYFKDIPKGIT